MASGDFQYVSWYEGVFQKIGFPLSKDFTILDLGCGVGECVSQFRDANYNSFGCDVDFPSTIEEPLRSLMGNRIIRKIEYSQDPPDGLEYYLNGGRLSRSYQTSYRLPFEDDTFDVIFSNVVFEHVMDYPITFSEINRVLKPTGVSVHTFPGQWSFKEPHVFVPFASKVQYFWWLYFWALMGVRNEFQHTLSAFETAKRNYWYLRRCTNYLSRRQIRRHVLRYFDDCRFVEEVYFDGVMQQAWEWFRRYPFLLDIYRAWYSDTEMRALVFGKKVVRKLK